VLYTILKNQYSSFRNYDRTIKHGVLSVKIHSVGIDQSLAQDAQKSLYIHRRIQKTLDEQRKMEKED
jgi:rare lipoprotein A (peptidoglycan hydrolase)